MRRSRRFADDDGSASLEFVTAGLVLLLPLVYLVLAMASIQAGALAIEGAARQAARVFVQSGSIAEAQAGAASAVQFALADHGVDPATVRVEVACALRPTQCLTRRGLVTVTIQIAVPLPLAPPILNGGLPMSVPLTASATQQVSRFWGAG